MRLNKCAIFSCIYINILFQFRQKATFCNAESLKIGIIGGGIGGTSASYFIRELFKNDVEIHLFEQLSTIGGRLATVEINGNHYESGGSIIHPKNLYMVQFLEKFGLKKRSGSEGTFGVFDGQQFVFTESAYNYVTVAKMLYRYGLDPYWLQKSIQYLLTHFSNIYSMQNEGYAFTNVGKLLTAMSPKFVERMRQNFTQVLNADGFSEKFISELINAIVRVNYGQSTNVNGFVGAVGVAGAQPDLWAVHGGNKLIPQHLLDVSQVNLHKCKVTSISRNTVDNHSIVCLDENNNEETFDGFNKIILAMPLTTDLKFINFDSIKHSIFPYHRLSATFFSGKLSNRFPCTSCPSEILSCNNSLFFNSIGKNSPVDFDQSRHRENNTVWKVFSNKPLTESEKKFLFDEIYISQSVQWLAYPEYEQNVFEPNDLRFELDENIFHINVIEAAASAMEMSVIGAKNVALLIYNKIKNNLDKVDTSPPVVAESKGDL